MIKPFGQNVGSVLIQPDFINVASDAFDQGQTLPQMLIAACQRHAGFEERLFLGGAPRMLQAEGDGVADHGLIPLTQLFSAQARGDTKPVISVCDTRAIANFATSREPGRGFVDRARIA